MNPLTAVVLASGVALTACAAPAPASKAEPITLPCTTVSLDAAPSEAAWLRSQLTASGRDVISPSKPLEVTLRVTVFPAPLWPTTQHAGFIDRTVEISGQRREVAARLAAIAPPCTTPEKEKNR